MELNHTPQWLTLLWTKKRKTYLPLQKIALFMVKTDDGDTLGQERLDCCEFLFSTEVNGSVGLMRCLGVNEDENGVPQGATFGPFLFLPHCCHSLAWMQMGNHITYGGRWWGDMQMSTINSMLCYLTLNLCSLGDISYNLPSLYRSMHICLPNLKFRYFLLRGERFILFFFLYFQIVPL